MTVHDGGSRLRGDAGSSILSLDDGDIYTCQEGPSGAPALLLIHGSASASRFWDSLVPLLTGSHRVIRVDLLGHGRSSKPDEGSYALQDQARRAGEVLDLLGFGQVIVVGHSSGGAVATALAEERPDLVAALVLINTGPSLDAFIASDSVAIGPEQWPPTDEQLRQFASTAVSRAGYQIPQELLDEMRAMTFHSLAMTMRATTDYLMRQALPDRLKVLGKPLLVIFGEDDRRWRSSSAADYHVVPDAKVVLLPGLGHSPILEDPPRTAIPLLAFTSSQGSDHD